jgi:uncharacterized Zn-binding protein involved in type VI secretion
MPGQGRLGDKAQIQADAHGCPGCPHPGVGPSIVGSTNVLVNGRPALRVDDVGLHAACCGGNMWSALQGSPTVFINGKAAFRQNDPTRHCGGQGKLIEGSSDVIVGGAAGGGSGAGGGGGGAANGGAGDAASGGGTAPPAPSSSSTAASAPPAKAATATDPNKTFVELELVDKKDQPVPFARYRVTDAAGTVFEGILDGQGRARIDDVAKGNYTITFVDFHGDEWSKA